MSNLTLPREAQKTLQDPALKEKLQQLRQTDNYTNFYYLARTWAYLAAAIGGTIWFYHFQASEGVSWWWNVPVTLLTIVMVGAGQHQLTGLAHEGGHHILFRNRYLNEIISDWFCMFPLFSSTHFYRLQHLAHHQFVNDPERDPDISQLQQSGHWLDFPLGKRAFLWTLVKQLWVPNLIRFMRIRATYNAGASEHNPYLRKGWKKSKTPFRVGLGYILGVTILLTLLVQLGDPWLLAGGTLIAWSAIMIFYTLIPGHWFHQSRIHAVISTRVMTLMRMTFITAVFSVVAWTTLLTGAPAALYFFLLWVVPIFTSFSFLMILRQLVQHGNGGRGWLTNTRIFFINRLINFGVFPMGQDYHLPHHLFATVPHYRLKQLHETLMAYPEYREQAVVIEGYFLPPHTPQTRPTVLDVLGADHAPDREQAVYIDNTVLEDVHVEDKDDILHEAEVSGRQG